MKRSRQIILRDRTTELPILALLFWLGASTCEAFYNPTAGRWPNRDPLGEPGFELLRGGLANLLGDGANVYALVDNDALNRTDFLGLHDAGSSIRYCDAVYSACAQDCAAAGGPRWCWDDCLRERRDCILNGDGQETSLSYHCHNETNDYHGRESCFDCCDKYFVAHGVWASSSYRSELALCTKLSPPWSGICATAATAKYALSVMSANKLHDKCLEGCGICE